MIERELRDIKKTIADIMEQLRKEQFTIEMSGIKVIVIQLRSTTSETGIFMQVWLYIELKQMQLMKG